MGILPLAFCLGLLGVHESGASLPSEAYSEGACISPQIVTAIDMNWIIQQKTFYVPIASQFAIHRYAETLLSRPPASEEELGTMCLTAEASQGTGPLNLTNVGFDDREFRQNCSPGSESGKISCSAAGSSAGVNPSKTRVTENFVVAWDTRTYMIVVRCVDEFFRDFLVLSTRPTVSHDVLHSVLNITRNLGFDERRIQTMTYDKCLRSSSGLNSSNFNLNQRTGPFTSNVLAAPFPQSHTQPALAVGSVVQQQNHQHHRQAPINHPQVETEHQIYHPQNRQLQQERFGYGQGLYGGEPQFPHPFGDPSGYPGAGQFL